METATRVCSVALWMDGDVVVEAALNRPRAHAENLVPLIGDVLRYGGIAPRDVDAVAVSAGPGSYTGLRIGASTAKGLIAAVDAELVAVPSLEALASAAADVISESDILLASFGARRDEVFAAAFFRQADGGLGIHRETAAIAPLDVVSWIGDVDGSIFLVGDGAAGIADAWDGKPTRMRHLSADVVRPSAASVARLGAERLFRGDVVDVANFEPFYLKDFVAKRPSASAFDKLPF